MTVGIRSAIVAAALLSLTISLSACGNDDTPAAAGTSSSAPRTTAAAAPTPEQLRKLLEALTDANKPAADKAKLITNGASKIQKIEDFTKKVGGYKVSFNPTKINPQGATATSEILVTSAMAPNAPAPVPMTFDFDGSEWKLSEASMCAVFGFARVPC